MDLQSIAKRFWAKVEVRGEYECWPWKGATVGRYGVLSVTSRPSRKRETAHRIAAKLAGWNVNDEDVVRHTCGNDLCCNVRHLYLKITPVALNPLVEYNPQQGSSASLAYDEDPLLRRLRPLRAGKSVVLAMDNPRAKKAKDPKYRGYTGPLLVVIAPGQMHGFASHKLLISIVGSGACVVDSRSPQKVANLVLAGMPARLAHELMNRVHLVTE